MFTSVGLNIDKSPIRTTIGGVSKEHIHFLVSVGKQKITINVSITVWVKTRKTSASMYTYIYVYIYIVIYTTYSSMYVHHIYIYTREYHVYHWDISHLSRDSNQPQPVFSLLCGQCCMQ